MQILIIDDDPMFRAMVQTIFNDAGDEVLCAPSASEGVELAKTVKPDLVLLDLSMPDGTGLDILPALRATPGWEAMPILMLTADDNIENLIEAGRRGARGYLGKPVQPDTLIAMVRDVLANPELVWVDDYGRVERGG